MAKKKKQNQGLDLSEPIDVFNLGLEEDPCFGKHYDLTTDECKRCGDSELCAIATANRLNSTRKQIESKNRFKDLEEVSPKRIRSFVKRRVAKGYTLKKIQRIGKKKLKVNSEIIKEAYKQIKKK